MNKKIILLISMILVITSYPNLSFADISSKEIKSSVQYSKAIEEPAKNRKNLPLNAKSAVIINATTGDILYDKKMNVRRQNASTTKIMTAILAFENSSVNAKTVISQKASKTGDRSVKFKKGDRVFIKNLLNCLLIESDNGSAVAIAESISGSSSKFAKKMNKKAKNLGCKNTHFVNPHGWPNKNHYSTAYDLAVMMKHAMNKKNFRKIVRKKSYTFKTLKKKDKFKVKTTNKLLGKIKGITGGKTGTTKAAGYCFVTTYRYKDNTYIIVVLGSKSNSKRWNDTKKLIKYIKKYE